MTAVTSEINSMLYVDETNKRIKMLGGKAAIQEVASAAIKMAESKGFGKIWGFVSSEEAGQLAELGFVREGELEGYYRAGAGIGIAYYLSPERAISQRTFEEDAIVRLSEEKATQAASQSPADYTFRAATSADTQRISDVLCQVFSSYPTPIDSAQAIADAMARSAFFMLAEYQGEIISVMSADIDLEHLVAEMTDCATLPEHRGKGLMQELLQQMEIEMRQRGLRALFTLARATSQAMNIAFARQEYQYRGRFINNCHIAGDWEDMNIWVKSLSARK